MQAKRWVVSRAGSLDRLSLESFVLPPLSEGQARVRVHSVGLNFADVFACLGLYSATPPGAFTPGLEFSGVVEEVARARGRTSAGGRIKKGDSVMGLIRFGGYSELINADVRYLHKLPARFTMEQGAAFPAQALTAWYALHRLGHVQKGETVLVQSAAGGVGLLALFLLQQAGAKAVCVVGSEEKVKFLNKFAGVQPSSVIVRQRRNFAERLAVAAPNGIDIALDAVYGRYFKPSWNALRGGGRYVLFGAADLMPEGKSPNYLLLGWQYMLRPRLDPLAMISENRSMLAFNLIWLWDRVDDLAGMMNDLLLLPWKKRPPHVGHTFPFSEAPAALRFFQSGKSVGKVVLSTGVSR